jgi:hypothetical protein
VRQSIDRSAGCIIKLRLEQALVEFQKMSGAEYGLVYKPGSTTEILQWLYSA